MVAPAVDVTAVITTFERPEACVRAVRSALEQVPPPREVLICDDGSSMTTLRRLEELERADSRVRLLAAPAPSGSPGPGRNRGLGSARTTWVGFLDDDDAWLPGKLARQLEWAATGQADVIGTNARRSDGSPYFPGAAPEWRPQRADLLRDNPLIVSSVLARRSVLEQAGGFPAERWARGVADYAMWLRLLDLDARFAVLGDVLVDYDDSGEDRMSSAPVRQEWAVARLFWHRWQGAPANRRALVAAARKTAAAARLTPMSVTRHLRRPR